MYIGRGVIEMGSFVEKGGGRCGWVDSLIEERKEGGWGIVLAFWTCLNRGAGLREILLRVYNYVWKR